MDAVEKSADARDVPPGRALEAEDHPRDDDHDQGGDRGDTEDVDPRGDVGGLAIGEQLLRRQCADRAVADPFGPHPRLALGAHGWRPRPGNGSRIAATNTKIINAITTTFATDIWKKCQCT